MRRIRVWQWSAPFSLESETNFVVKLRSGDVVSYLPVAIKDVKAAKVIVFGHAAGKLHTNYLIRNRTKVWTSRKALSS